MDLRCTRQFRLYLYENKFSRIRTKRTLRHQKGTAHTRVHFKQTKHAIPYQMNINARKKIWRKITNILFPVKDKLIYTFRIIINWQKKMIILK